MRCQYSMNSAWDFPVGSEWRGPGFSVAAWSVSAPKDRAPGTGEYDDPTRAVGVRLIETPVQLSLELMCERIHAIRPVERDGRDLVLDLIKQLLSHPASLMFVARIERSEIRGQPPRISLRSTRATDWLDRTSSSNPQSHHAAGRQTSHDLSPRLWALSIARHAGGNAA